MDLHDQPHQITWLTTFHWRVSPTSIVKGYRVNVFKERTQATNNWLEIMNHLIFQQPELKSTHKDWKRGARKKSEKVPWVFPKKWYPQIIDLRGFSIINHTFWGTPILGNTHIFSQLGSNSSCWRGLFLWITLALYSSRAEVASSD